MAIILRFYPAGYVKETSNFAKLQNAPPPAKQSANETKGRRRFEFGAKEIKCGSRTIGLEGFVPN